MDIEFIMDTATFSLSVEVIIFFVILPLAVRNYLHNFLILKCLYISKIKSTFSW